MDFLANMSNTQIWLCGSVGIYMLVMLLIGFWCGKKINDTRDYIIAGRHLGWLLSIGTICATWFGAETCMGSSRMAFEGGILAVIADPFGAGLCLILSGVFFVKYLYRLEAQTIVDFFEIRYGKGIAQVLIILYIPVYLGWVGAQLLAFGIILNALTGMPQMAGILISTAVVIIYTFQGGMWADSITDLVQMVFIVLGLVILFPVMVADMGGWTAITSQVSKENFHFYPHTSGPLDWLNYLQAWMIVGIGSLPAQDLFQRVMSPRSATIAKWSSIIAGVLYIILGFLPMLLGIFGRIALPESTGESILIELSLKYLPIPLIALMVGALISAIMSTVGSAILAPAGIIGHNVIAYLKPEASEELKLQWCKWSIPIVGILSLILALKFQNIYELCVNSWGVLLVGVAAPMIGGIYWKGATAKGAGAAAFCGTLAWMISMKFMPEEHPHNLYGFVVSWIALVTVSLVSQERVARVNAHL